MTKVKKPSQKPLPAHLKAVAHHNTKSPSSARVQKNPATENNGKNAAQKVKEIKKTTAQPTSATNEEDEEPDQKMNENFLFEFDGGSLLKSRSNPLIIQPNVVNDFAEEFNSDSEQEDEVKNQMEDGSDSDSDSEAGDNENHDINSDNDSDVELEIASEVESDSEDALPQTNDIVRDKRIAEYFAPAPVDSSGPTITSFTQLKLSRPILKAIATIGYSKPTEIQAKAIPLAMQGKDLCGAAVTGSGKTAAFMIPILERLLHRPKSVPAIRVLVIAPTRELSLQIHAVTRNLALFTDISSCLCVGGLQSKLQEQELRMRPDIVICTPGRLIDHLKNTPGFSLDAIDVLVMDEADRMLEDGFREELTEIIKSCPRTRQTMLFSATMTENVDDLIRLSLNTPIRLFVDENTAMTKRLVQEFVRVRDETMKLPFLLALIKTYSKETIIFFKSKVATHETKLLFQLIGLKAAELHGDLNQQDRMASLEAFKLKQVDFLLCTDLASRGIDVPNVKTVINFDMPSQYSHYIHRCGRTARAGMKGTACSFIQESDRRIMKIVIKKVSGDVKQRIPCKETTEKYITQLPELLAKVKVLLEQEKELKIIDSEMQKITRMQNSIEFDEDIKSRPKREWFQTTKEKEASKELALKDHKTKMGIPEKKQEIKRNKFDGLSRRKKRNLECREEDARSIANQKKSAKSKKATLKPQKIRKMK